MIKSGASIMPRKMLEAQPRPSAPPIFIVRSSARAKPLTMSDRIPQCQSSAERADITITMGRTVKAIVTTALGLLIVKGAAPPPT